MAQPLAAARPEFKLKVVESTVAARVGQETRLEGEGVIGRGDDATIVLKDQSVSRKHARIEPTPTGFRVVDNGSSNGLWVAEQRVSDVTLVHGTRFRIGETTFECVAPATVPRPAAAQSDGTVMTTGLGFVVRVVESKGGAMAVGTEFKVPTGAATIGRGEDCTIPLKDGSASRLHARLEAAGAGGWRLTDNKSSNGVWVGEERVESVVLAPGQRFRIGDTILECQPQLQPKKAAQAEGTVMMKDLGVLMAKAATRRLEGEGEAVPVSGSRIVVLNDPALAYYVVSGKVEVFTATFKDGRPLGARNHFLTLMPGEAFFGFDPGNSPDSGFLASGKSGTLVRRIPVERLMELAGEPGLAETIAELVEKWVGGLSARLTRDVFPRPTVDLRVAPGAAPVALEAGKRARTAEGVVWLEVEPYNVLYIGMSTLMFDAERMLFPLSPQSWVEPAGGAEKIELQGRATKDVLRDPALWGGIWLFHQVLCECEFINKRLAVVDEFQRLSSKAKQSEAAKDAAYDAIGAVLAGKTESTSFGGTGKGEPVVQACRLVGEQIGIKVKTPPEAKQQQSLEEHIASVASASRFRTRKVVLYGPWWTHDNGPLLGRREDTGTAVALLPKGTNAYECVDPAAKTRVKVDAELVSKLNPFAYTFYRGFPAGKLDVGALLRFGSRGLGSDFRWLLFMGVLTGVLGAATPYLTGQMIDSAIPQSEKGLLLQLGAAMFLVALANALFKVVQSVSVVRVESRMDYVLQAALWDRLLDLPSAFFRKYGAGDLADRANGINQIRGLISRAGVSGILGSISSIFYVILMFFYSAKLGAVAIGITAVLVSVTTLGNYWQLKYQREEQLLKGRIQGLVLQLITGVAKVRVCAAENHAFRVWAQRFSEQRQLAVAIGRIQNMVATFSASFSVLSSLGIFGMLWYFQSGAKPGEGPDFSTGTFIAFNSAFGSFVTAVQSLAEASLSLLRAVPVFERLKPILESVPESDESKSHPGRLRGEITISNMFFRYREDGPYIVKGVSLKIEPGEFVAFVGSSGCGKSTMMRLMLGFEKPGQGAIYYDGQDLATLDVRMVRSQMGVVLQESRVLPTDIYRNIVGTSNRGMDEAWEAAEMSGLAEDIREMPMGMHTVVSEGGGTFSGGQRQRLLIARALVNKPRIIFLDEATSALDNRTQALVTQSMDRMDATRIVIAHRLSTVVNADKIVYLDGGEIKEVGSYEELMALNGRFAELARRQIA